MLTLPKVTDQIGRYKLLSELGRGSIGQVYLALDPNIDRYVALKVCMPLLKVGSKERLELRRRFVLEAKAAARVRHPGIVTIFDADTDPETDLSYIAMEWVEGRSLQEVLTDNGPMDPATTVEIVEQAALALDAAHREGLVHRDVKPGNILCGKDGATKVTDFGIAKVASMSITQSSWIPGSPFYMSPEQVRNEDVDQRTDIYALGAVLYECLTGSVPFNGDSLASLTYMILDIDPRPPQTINPRVSDELAQVAMRALAKSASDRFQSAVDMVHALRASEPHSGGKVTSIVGTRPFEVLPAVEPLPDASATSTVPMPAVPAAPPRTDSGAPTAHAAKISPVWWLIALLAVAGASLALRFDGWRPGSVAMSAESLPGQPRVERPRGFVASGVESSLDGASIDGTPIPVEAETEAEPSSEESAVVRSRLAIEAPAPRPKRPAVAPEPRVETPPEVPPLEEVVPETVDEPVVESQAAVRSAPVADSRLEIVFRNRLKSGSIMVTIDDEKVWTQLFSGADNFFKRTIGRDVWTTIPIPAGAHVIDVRVSGSEGKIDLVRRTEETFTAGETRRLRVVFMPPKTLRLSWRDAEND